MRIVYDDNMQSTFVQAVSHFMETLRIAEVTRYENGMDRIQMYLVKEKLNRYLQDYHIEIGQTVTHAHGIGNNCQYPVYYHPEDATEIQQCAYINLNIGLYGEGYLSCEDYNGNRIGNTYELHKFGIKQM